MTTTHHWLLARKQFSNTPIPGSDLEQRMHELDPENVEPEKEDNPVVKQGRLFNPDNPPQAFSKKEGNVHLAKIKEELRHEHLARVNRHNLEKRR